MKEGSVWVYFILQAHYFVSSGLHQGMREYLVWILHFQPALMARPGGVQMHGIFGAGVGGGDKPYPLFTPFSNWRGASYCT